MSNARQQGAKSRLKVYTKTVNALSK